jgi:hypothetical protein
LNTKQPVMAFQVWQGCWLAGPEGVMENCSYTLIVLVDTDFVAVVVAVAVAMPGPVGIAVGRNIYAQREDPAG